MDLDQSTEKVWTVEQPRPTLISMSTPRHLTSLVGLIKEELRFGKFVLSEYPNIKGIFLPSYSDSSQMTDSGENFTAAVKTELQPYDGTNLVLLPHRQSCDEEVMLEGDACSDSGHSSLDTFNTCQYTNSPLVQFWQNRSSQLQAQFSG